MSEYKRLTHRNGNRIEEYCEVGHCKYADFRVCKFKGIEHNVDEDCIPAMIERLAELEDKIEQGTLIELPCKVGDTVYCVDRNRVACFECEHYSSFYGMDEHCDKGCAIYPTIEKSKPICNKHFFEIDKIKFDLRWYLNYKDGFNKDWFLTREEAEKRLKELQE